MGKFKAVLKGIKDNQKQRLMDKEEQAVYRLKQSLMKQENLTWEEVCEKCHTDPEFSYCEKFQRSFVWMIGDPAHMKEHRDAFLEGLTEEERIVHQREVDNGTWDHVLREAMKARKRK